jgi:hypothetical protein
MMSARSFFKKASDGFARFLENQEIAALNDSIEIAKRGQNYVAARGGAVPVSVSPERAQKTIEECTERLAEIERKRNANLTPKP